MLMRSMKADADIFPQFGRTLFFEHALTNPFGHAERFLVEIEPAAESELQLVGSVEERGRTRRTSRRVRAVGAAVSPT